MELSTTQITYRWSYKCAEEMLIKIWSPGSNPPRSHKLSFPTSSGTNSKAFCNVNLAL
jgi:hypothetical protein